MSARSTKSSSKPEKRKVRAVTRIRPFFATDANPCSHSEGLESCVAAISKTEIGFRQQKYSEIIEQRFHFDAVYKTNSKQEQIFENEVTPLMKHILNGKNCTIFCYGPTGSGKTFTAFGCNDNLGIMARTMQSVLDMKSDTLKENMNKNNKYKCKISLSSLEIYNERVYDLLSTNNINKQGLPIRQNGDKIVVQGLTMIEIISMQQFYELYKRSMTRRKSASTELNSHSSRSHAIFTIHFEQNMEVLSNTKKHSSKTRFIHGKLSIADLAGSENNKRTLNTGDRLMESKNINKSLFALGKVIDALNRGHKPPYRDSALTRLLSDSLGGSNISTMICCVSGLLAEGSMTRRCLEFGSNTRKIENKVIAHIENISQNSDQIRRKKRKYNEISSPNQKSNSNNKRMRLKKVNKISQNNDNKKKIRYSIQPTPSKIIPNDKLNLQKHEAIVQNKMLHKIDELTKNVRIMHEHLVKQKSDESKDEEKEISVYKNDEYGLPPAYTPVLANTNLAIQKIKKGRELEKNGKIKEALVHYKRAKVLCPRHKGLEKKIQNLQMKIESDVVKQLHFDDDSEIISEEHKPMQPIKIKRKRRKTLRKKVTIEILSSDDNESDSNNGDSDVLNGYTYTVDTERLLQIVNDSTTKQLKCLATVGASKAAAIELHRPFTTTAGLRKVKGFHTRKYWDKFIENNEITFIAKN